MIPAHAGTADCDRSNTDADEKQTVHVCDDSHVNALWEEVQGFVLADHLVSGLWAVNQASTSTSAVVGSCNATNNGADVADDEKFDYLHYAKCRLERYAHYKAAWGSRPYKRL